MMRALLATLFLVLISTPSLATEPPIVNRHGPGASIFDHQPFATKRSRTIRSANQRHVKRHLSGKSAREPVSRRSLSLAGVVAPLAAKAEEIKSACGSVVVSAVSHRGNRSNHPIGRAVDMQGNPTCIMAHLKGWPGGVSIDYHTAPGGPHTHISYNPNGQEWGLRFAHAARRGFTRRVRYAKF